MENYEQKTIRQRDVPDCLFPSDNDLGIPTLDASMQGDYLDLPFQVYNDTSLKKLRAAGGTVSFYTEDRRFVDLWRDPTKILNSKIISVVEPNFSVYSQQPPAVAVWATYRKRWLARYWQSQGLRVWVDLNVAPRFAALNLAGVPCGWKAYMTRGYNERCAAIDYEMALARQKAGSENIRFVVYGGGREVDNYCRDRGLLHVQEGRQRITQEEVDSWLKEQEVGEAALGRELEAVAGASLPPASELPLTSWQAR